MEKINDHYNFPKLCEDSSYSKHRKTKSMNVQEPTTEDFWEDAENDQVEKEKFADLPTERK